MPVDEASKNVVLIETALGDALTGVGNRMIELHSAKVNECGARANESERREMRECVTLCANL